MPRRVRAVVVLVFAALVTACSSEAPATSSVAPAAQPTDASTATFIDAFRQTPDPMFPSFPTPEGSVQGPVTTKGERPDAPRTAEWTATPGRTYDEVVAYFSSLDDARWKAAGDLGIPGMHRFDFTDADGIFGSVQLTVYAAFEPVRFSALFLPPLPSAGPPDPLPPATPGVDVTIPASISKDLIPQGGILLAAGEAMGLAVVQVRLETGLEEARARCIEALERAGQSYTSRQDASGITLTVGTDGKGGTIAIEPMADGSTRVSILEDLP